jgi:hypothetical protein
VDGEVVVVVGCCADDGALVWGVSGKRGERSEAGGWGVAMG